ncbi:MAG: hypothetical protein LBQ62_05840 [Candidatus Accumulibacter sp.]|jgi:hypothetical protein|nr:hypothetical protein [Accumulibacter sp.]
MPRETIEKILDVIPALACASHLLMRPAGLLAHVRAGVALQRLWLTAASLGLHLRPEMTPLVFRWYARAQREFSFPPRLASQARALATRFESLAEAKEDDSFSFFCRVGHSSHPRSRSLRRTLDELFAK